MSTDMRQVAARHPLAWLWWAGCVLWALVVACPAAALRAASVPDARQSAARVDSLLAQEHFGAEGTKLPPQPTKIVDDETFLRRVSLDLIGSLPAPEEVTRFALDSDPNKRGVLVERLMADKQFGPEVGPLLGKNVVLYRRREEQAAVGCAPGRPASWIGRSVESETNTGIRSPRR